LSSDGTLTALSLVTKTGSVTLDPSSAIQSVQVSNSTASVNVTASAKHQMALVFINGVSSHQGDVTVGIPFAETLINITVVSEEGSSFARFVNVFRNGRSLQLILKLVNFVA
jgi:hypothetical protein